MVVKSGSKCQVPDPVRAAGCGQAPLPVAALRPPARLRLPLLRGLPRHQHLQLLPPRLHTPAHTHLPQVRKISANKGKKYLVYRPFWLAMDQYGYLDEADGCAAGQRSHRHQLELARAFLETHRGENLEQCRCQLHTISYLIFTSHI